MSCISTTCISIYVVNWVRLRYLKVTLVLYIVCVTQWTYLLKPKMQTIMKLWTQYPFVSKSIVVDKEVIGFCSSVNLTLVNCGGRWDPLLILLKNEPSSLATSSGSAMCSSFICEAVHSVLHMKVYYTVDWTELNWSLKSARQGCRTTPSYLHCSHLLCTHTT